MTINWGDIVINDMANRDENRAREAQFLANANRYLTAEPKRTFTGLVQAIRQQFNKARMAGQADANRNFEPHQKPTTST